MELGRDRAQRLLWVGEDEVGGARLGWQASLWGGPSCFDEARRGPEIFSLEALVVPFWGAGGGGNPAPVKEPCRRPLRGEHHPAPWCRSALSLVTRSPLRVGRVGVGLRAVLCPETTPRKVLEGWLERRL